MSVELHRLSNGFRIVTEHMPGLKSASLGIWVNAGGRHERIEQNGIAHFLEHMAFKGTTSRSALQRLRMEFDSGDCSEDETSAAIATLYRMTGEVVCPHTAVGVAVAEDHQGRNPMVTLATAHPAKFPDAVEGATGLRPPLPPRMADLFDRPERVTRMTSDRAALQALILDRIGMGAGA